ncbi:hypothetical protein DFS34DRAFT_606888 [Phlyctochytrium arcticum]|nr:hypothetical protein DFS34DRAFT_606888 [Phlyctochytrium arcticum]
MAVWDKRSEPGGPLVDNGRGSQRLLLVFLIWVGLVCVWATPSAAAVDVQPFSSSKVRLDIRDGDLDLGIFGVHDDDDDYHHRQEDYFDDDDDDETTTTKSTLKTTVKTTTTTLVQAITSIVTTQQPTIVPSISVDAKVVVIPTATSTTPPPPPPTSDPPIPSPTSSPAPIPLPLPKEAPLPKNAPKEASKEPKSSKTSESTTSSSKATKTRATALPIQTTVGGPASATAAQLKAAGLKDLIGGDTNLTFQYGIDSFEPSNALSLYWKVELAQLHCLVIFNATRYWQQQQFTSTPSIWNSWVGLGFGPSMLTADMLMLFANPTTRRLTLTEVTSKRYSDPVPQRSRVIEIDNLLQTVVDQRVMIFEFNRPMRPGDSSHWNIDADEPFRIIWAFSVSPDPRNPGGPSDWHGPENRGVHSLNFLTGENNPVGDGLKSKVIHAVGMSVAWGIFLPLGVWWARYRRHTNNWLLIHITAQSAGSLITIVFVSSVFVALRPDDPRNTPSADKHDQRPHPLAGFFLFAAIVFQFGLGLFNRLRLRFGWFESKEWPGRLIGMVHTYMGRVLLVLGFAQAYLGLDILYPLEDNKVRGRLVWVLYFLSMGVWIALVAGGEATAWWDRRKHRDLRPPPFESAKNSDVKNFKTLNSTTSPKTLFSKRNVKAGIDASSDRIALRRLSSDQNEAQPSTSTIDYAMALSADAIKEQVQLYTWQDIATATEQGKLLVVANGTYIYDISKFIGSHPGGQSIMHSVAGTDITNDFFGQAGVDADKFYKVMGDERSVSRLIQDRLSKKESTTTRESFKHRSVANSATSSNFPMRKSAARGRSMLRSSPPVYGSSGFTEKEWKLIMKSRRTHVHTPSAISRLTTLLVGELVSPGQSGTLARGHDGTMSRKRLVDGSDNLSSDKAVSRKESSASSHSRSSTPWTPAEYRRYALVSSTLVSPQGHSPAVYRLRFTLLYPNAYPSPPDFFPGQVIQLQTRVQSRIETRFYTPIEGNMGGFDIIVKTSATEGLVSSFLTKSKAGERQWKIRGPCGIPIFQPPAPSFIPQHQYLAFSTDAPARTDEAMVYPDNMVFITAGSAMVAALQTIQYLFLPTNIAIEACAQYEPQEPDELAVEPSHKILLHGHSYDGWAEGMNLSTNEAGMFPLGVTYPRCGPLPVITLVTCVHSVDDITDLDMFTGALLAYPGQVRLVWVVSTGSTKSLPHDHTVHEGHLTQDILDHVLRETAQWNFDSKSNNHDSTTDDLVDDFVAYMNDEKIPGSSSPPPPQQPKDQRVVICGPPNFEGSTYELLVEGLCIAHTDVRVMSHEPSVSLESI